MKRFLIWVLFLISAVCAFAVTLDEALNLALENNVLIKREKILLGAAKRAYDHGWNNFLLSFTVSANDEIVLPDLADNSNDAADGNAGIRNNFAAEGKIEISVSSDFLVSVQKAKLDYEAKKISFDEVVAEITLQVKETYFSLILAKQNLDFFNENLENAKALAEQNEERYRRGTLSETEYLLSKISYKKLKPELKSSELSYKKDLKSFSVFLGLEADEITLEGTLEDFIAQYDKLYDDTKKAELSEAVKHGNVPSILSLKKQIKAAHKDVSAARLLVYGPSVNLSYSVNPVLTGAEHGRVKHSASIGVSVSPENFLPFSKGADTIKTALDSVKVLELQLNEKNKALNAEFSNIIQSLTQKQESIAAYKDFVSLTMANYDATKYAYSKGMAEFLSMQNALKENLEAKLNLQNESLEILKLYISLEKLCGGI